MTTTPSVCAAIAVAVSFTVYNPPRNTELSSRRANPLGRKPAMVDTGGSRNRREQITINVLKLLCPRKSRRE